VPDTSGTNDIPPAPAEHRPMTILMGCDTFAPDVNGAARFAERLAAGLVARGHDMHVVAPAAGRRHGTWIEEHEGEKIEIGERFDPVAKQPLTRTILGKELTEHTTSP